MTITSKSLSVNDAIESRRSIRQYRQEPIPRADIDEILRLMRLAPSAYNIQPWRFIVVTDLKLKKQLKEAAYGQAQVGNAPAVIVVTSDMEDVLANLEEIIPNSMDDAKAEAYQKRLQKTFEAMGVEGRARYGATQTYIALGFLLIAAKSFGYDTSAMLGFDPAKVRALLDLPEYVQLPALVALGRGTEAGYPRHRHSLERIVTYR
jgi:nitroreductase